LTGAYWEWRFGALLRHVEVAIDRLAENRNHLILEAAEELDPGRICVAVEDVALHILIPGALSRAFQRSQFTASRAWVRTASSKLMYTLRSVRHGLDTFG